jgi:hypothetical protein
LPRRDRGRCHCLFLRASLPRSAERAYKIGYITDLLALSLVYTPTWEGFELYIKALNDRGGISKKVDVSSTTMAR